MLFLLQLVFTALLACAVAKPQFFYPGYTPFGYAAAPAISYAAAPAYTAYTAAAPAIVAAPAFTKTQYHAQDELGQASYGYAHPGQAHSAHRDAFGNVVGSYAYIDPNGKEVRVNYVADHNGFRVASNALPEGPAVPAVQALVAPVPVQDTPEVAQAKADHAKAVEEAIARNAQAGDETGETNNDAEATVVESARRKKRGVAYTLAAHPAITYAAGIHHYGYAAAPVAYGYAAAPAVVAAAPAVVAAAPAQPLREATLTKVVNTPGHAVSYRVD